MPIVRARRRLSEVPFHWSVRTAEGDTAFTVMPNGASSTAIPRVRPQRALFAATYAEVSGGGVPHTAEVRTFTKRPKRRSFMPGMIRCDSVYALCTYARQYESKSSHDSSVNGLRTIGGLALPTTTSTRP